MKDEQIKAIKAMSEFVKQAGIKNDYSLMEINSSIADALANETCFSIIQTIIDDMNGILDLSYRDVEELYKKYNAIEDKQNVEEAMMCMFLDCYKIPSEVWEAIINASVYSMSVFDKMMTHGIPDVELHYHWETVAKACQMNLPYLPTNSKLYCQKYHGKTLEYIAKKINDEKFCPIQKGESPTTAFVARYSILAHVHPYSSVGSDFTSRAVSSLLKRLVEQPNHATLASEEDIAKFSKDEVSMVSLAMMNEEQKIISALRNPYLTPDARGEILQCYEGDVLKCATNATPQYITEIYLAALEGLEYEIKGETAYNILMVEKALSSGKISPEIIELTLPSLEKMITPTILKAITKNLTAINDDVVLSILNMPCMKKLELRHTLITNLSIRNAITDKITRAVCKINENKGYDSWMFQDIVAKCGKVSELTPAHYKRIVAMSRTDDEEFRDNILYHVHSNATNPGFVRDIMLSHATPQDVYEQIKKNISAHKEAYAARMLITIHEFEDNCIDEITLAKQIEYMTPVLSSPTVYNPLIVIDHFEKFEELFRNTSIDKGGLMSLLEKIEENKGFAPGRNGLVDVCRQYINCGCNAERFFDAQFGNYAPVLKATYLAKKTMQKMFIKLELNLEDATVFCKSKPICDVPKLIATVIKDGNLYAHYKEENERLLGATDTFIR